VNSPALPCTTQGDRHGVLGVMIEAITQLVQTR
jgi:hypothetical protein